MIATIWFSFGAIVGWLLGVAPLTSAVAYLVISFFCMLLFNLTPRGQQVFETLFSDRPDAPEPGCYEKLLVVFLIAFPVISLTIGVMVFILRMIARLSFLQKV